MTRKEGEMRTKMIKSVGAKRTQRIAPYSKATFCTLFDFTK